MEKTIHNSVRQVLVNELGLTRESVREETREFVREAVEKEVARMLAADQLRALIGDILLRTKTSIGYGETLRDWINTAGRAAIVEWVKENVKIEKKQP